MMVMMRQLLSFMKRQKNSGKKLEVLKEGGFESGRHGRRAENVVEEIRVLH